MKVFYNSKLAKCLLFGNFKTCMFFGVVITKRLQISARSKRHEGIHIQQYWECYALGVVLWCVGHGAAHLFSGHLSAWWLLLGPFVYYLLYIVEWAISYAYHIARGDARDRWNDEAYHASAFEMEAYAHENDLEYRHKRRWFAFVKYYGKI